jgi:hypothetical protein
LFRITRCKEALMADHVQFLTGNLQSNFSFTSSVHDWEVDLVTAFLDLLYSIG